MPVYKRRPMFVDAVQFLDRDHPPRGVRLTSAGTPVCDTSSGVARVYPTEWICADVDGAHFYPMSDELFTKLYDVDVVILSRPKLEVVK